MEKYKYDCWDGGPFIVLPQKLISMWRGYDIGINPLDPKKDYGRACAIKGKFDLIAVGDGQALVLGPDPPMVAYSPRSSRDQIDLFILQSWKEQDLDSLLDAALKGAEFKPTGKTWDLHDDLLRMHYAGDDPNQPVAGRTDIACTTAKYEILLAEHKSEGGEVTLIRLTNVSK